MNVSHTLSQDGKYLKYAVPMFMLFGASCA